MTTPKRDVYLTIGRDHAWRISLVLLSMFFILSIMPAALMRDWKNGVFESVVWVIAWLFIVGASFIVGEKLKPDWEMFCLIRTLPVSRTQLATYCWFLVVAFAPLFVQVATLPYYMFFAVSDNYAHPLVEWLFRGTVYVAMNGISYGYRKAGCLRVFLVGAAALFMLRSGFVLIPWCAAFVGLTSAIYSFKFRENQIPDAFRPEFSREESEIEFNSIRDLPKPSRYPVLADLLLPKIGAGIVLLLVSVIPLALLWHYKGSGKLHDLSTHQPVWAVTMSLLTALFVQDKNLRAKTRVYRALPIATHQFVFQFATIPIFVTMSVSVFALIAAWMLDAISVFPAISGFIMALGIGSIAAIYPFLPRRRQFDQFGVRIVMFTAGLVSLGFGAEFDSLQIPIGVLAFVCSLTFLNHLLKTKSEIYAPFLLSELWRG